MTKLIFPAILLTFTVYSFMPAAFAQDNETAAPPVTGADETALEEPAVRASQEVEINEDNYRQFMELKDANLERGVVPENVFKPGTGLQKLDKLPEASQKHLRNELREIIVQGDPWQPGDADKEFAYVPSEAAGKDPALQNQEMEAWGELVGSYHQREAQIYENSAGSRAARGSEQGSGSSTQTDLESVSNSGQDGEGIEAQQAGHEGNPDQGDTQGTYSLNGSGSADADNTAGVSQNAMEYLRDLGKGNTGPEEGPNKNSTESIAANEGASGNQSGEQRETQGDGQAHRQGDDHSNEGQRPEYVTEPASSASSARATQVSSVEPEHESSAGAAQNALNYLTGKSDQALGSTGDESTRGQPEGTLSIQDLLNARGVGDSDGEVTLENAPGIDQQTDKDKPGKDTGG